MRKFIMLILISFLSSEVISQDYIAYDGLIQKARHKLYSEKDTLGSLKTFEKAIRSVEHPFAIHFNEYFNLTCNYEDYKGDKKIPKNYNYVFFNIDDKNLFYENNCLTEDVVSSRILKDQSKRKEIDKIFLQDQQIDRSSKNKIQLFSEIINKFRLFIAENGFPTEAMLGLYLDKKGNILTSPVNTLLIHAIQFESTYFNNNLENFYMRGFITGSQYRVLENITED